MRKSMVTRTITTTKVNVMCLNIENGECVNELVVLQGTPKAEKILKLVSAKIDSEVLKAVHVVDVEKCEELYGMYEEDFVTHGFKLDADRKAIEK